jgi:hypothetical protein
LQPFAHRKHTPGPVQSGGLERQHLAEQRHQRWAKPTWCDPDTHTELADKRDRISPPGQVYRMLNEAAWRDSIR